MRTLQVPNKLILTAYGLGSVASAAKSAPISAFLVIYYNQVVGMPPLTVSAVLMATLVLDAILDPVVGQVSDGWRSRWGRRLPFMYASLIPVTLFFIALWNPPDGLSEPMLATYLFVCLAGVRIFDTLFELPHLAVIPELTADQRARTSLYTWRYLFEAAGGILVSALAYNVFLKDNPDGTGGLLDRSGYPAFSLFCGVLVFGLMLVCTLGLRRTLIARPSQGDGTRPSVGDRVRLFLATINSRPVILLSAVAIMVSIGSGMGQSLSMYWLLYYFQFSQSELSLLLVAVMLGIGLTGLAPLLGRWLGKGGAVVLCCWMYFAVSAVPLLSRYFEILPAGSHMLLGLVLLQSASGAASMTMTIILLTSMVADLTEEAEQRTGQRSEAMLLASISFVRKATQGLGALGAGFILSLAMFPQSVERSEVASGILDEMAGLYLAGKFVIFTAVTLLVVVYRRTCEKAGAVARHLPADRCPPTA